MKKKPLYSRMLYVVEPLITKKCCTQWNPTASVFHTLEHTLLTIIYVWWGHPFNQDAFWLVVFCWGGPSATFHTLKIHTPPPPGIEVGFEVHPEDTLAHKEGAVVLRCSPPHSVPPATITWTRNGESLDLATPGTRLSLAPSGNLYILNATLSDGGMYQCLATNPVTRTMRRSNLAMLSVQGKDT